MNGHLKSLTTVLKRSGAVGMEAVADMNRGVL